MGVGKPSGLSPSSFSAFKDCALAFRFSYLDKLPQPPSAPASKGTLVHRALELLMLRDPQDRTLPNALADLDRARADLAADPDFTDLDLTLDEWEQFHADAEVLVRKYFELEDPTTIVPIGLELRLAATIGRVQLRGIIDRLELDADGELVVTDYKTGSVPSERYEIKRLAGVHMYAAMVQHVLGKRPVRVQLLYLSKPEAIITTPSEQSVTGVMRKTDALWSAIGRSCERDDFRPNPGILCNWCAYKAYCPAFGGDPLQAVELRGAGHMIEPTLPLAATFGLVHPSVDRIDAAVDRAVERFRTPALDAVMYPVSSSADHSLLWFIIGTGLSVRRGDLRYAARFAIAMGLESAVTNGPVKSMFRRSRPAPRVLEGPLPFGMRRPITSSFPSGHATAAFTAAVLLADRHPGRWYALAAVVAGSRVYVGMHHASDVVVGAGFGLAFGHALRRWVGTPGR